MSVQVREFCDCCRDEITGLDGETVYRKRVRRFHWPYWPRNQPPEVEWAVVCKKCWNAIGAAATGKSAEAARVIEAARAVDRIYEGLRVDANDGTFSLWSENDLIVVLHELHPALAALAGREEQGGG